jgi:hypothetical protein
MPARSRSNVHLTKKFANFLDGIDLSRVKAGEHIELSEREARILVAEGWARPISAAERRAIAADKSPRRRRRTTTKKTR